MSRCSSDPATPQRDRCRTYRSNGATCSRDHVALIGRAERHAHASMSRLCVRTVARVGRAERHALEIMSHLSVERSDMHSRACRTYAFVRSRVSVKRSDMHSRACRTYRSSGATCTHDEVDPSRRAWRHAERSVSPGSIVRSDMNDRAFAGPRSPCPARRRTVPCPASARLGSAWRRARRRTSRSDCSATPPSPKRAPSPSTARPRTADRGPTLLSRRDGHQAPLAVRSERKAGVNVIGRKVRKVREYLRLRHARREGLEHVVHRDAQPADAWLAATFPGSIVTMAR
jgi:hypothetical protein